MKSRETSNQGWGGPLWLSPTVRRGRRWLTKRKAARLPLWCESPAPTRRMWHSRATTAQQETRNYPLAQPQKTMGSKNCYPNKNKNITYTHPHTQPIFILFILPNISSNNSFRKNSENIKQTNQQPSCIQLDKKKKIPCFISFIHLIICLFIH